MSLSARIRLAPIIVAMVYLNGTVLLLASGIWPWPLTQPFRVYGYLILANACLLLGYLGVAFQAPRSYDGRWSLKTVFWACAGTTLILLPATFKARTGTWLPDVFEGITNPGHAYSQAVKASSSTNLVGYIRILLGLPLTLLTPLAIYEWTRLSRRMRVAAVVCIGGNVAIYVAIGTNKGIADTVVLLGVLVPAAVITGRIKLTRRRGLILGAAACTVAVAFFAFFSAGQFDRSGGLATGLAINTTRVNWKSPARPPEERYAALVARGAAYGAGRNLAAPADLVVANRKALLLKPLPDRLARAVIAFTGYLTQGYYGMSLAMQQPYVPTFGVGSSYFLVRNASRLLHWPGLEDRPYPMRVETHDGWDAWGHWTAWYGWVASDVTFPGTLLILLLLGRLLALSWLDTVEGSNPFAIGLFGVCMLIIAYMPANNQILTDGESAVGLVGLLALWLVTRRRVASTMPGAASSGYTARGSAMTGRFLRIGPDARGFPGRRTVALCALLCIVGGVIGVWLRPVAGRPSPSAQGDLVLHFPAAERAAARAADARFLANIVRAPKFVAVTQAALPPASSKQAQESEVGTAVTAGDGVAVQVRAPTLVMARLLVNALVRHVKALSSTLVNRLREDVLPLAKFAGGEYAAAPERIRLTRSAGRFGRALTVTCRAVAVCGPGLTSTHPIRALDGYRATAEVRSLSPRPVRVLLALGDVGAVSTSAVRTVASHWTRLAVRWVPRRQPSSMSIDVQTARPAVAEFEIADVVVSRILSRPRRAAARIDRILSLARAATIVSARDEIAVGTSPEWVWAGVGLLVGFLIALLNLGVWNRLGR